MAKKVLILYTSVGLGHKSIAENIGWYLRQAGFEVKLADIGQVQKGKFEKIVVGMHQFINKYLPFVWGFMYRWGHYIILPFRITIAGYNNKQALNLINEFKPDLIISTQTTSSAVVSYLKKKHLYSGKFGIAFSDYHLHPYWLYNEADFYLVNIKEQKEEMEKIGISSRKIFVCGMTLKPKAAVDVLAVKQKFGVSAQDKVILIGTGSLGLGFKQKDLGELVKLNNVKIIFVCGRNVAQLEAIKNLDYPNVIPLGFYEPMSELYAISDIFIGKPGGLSTAEALQWGLPLLVTYTLPGQEQENVKYLVDRQLVMPRPGNLIEAVSRELKGGDFKKQLSANRFALEIIGSGSVLLEGVKKLLGEH